MNTEALLRKYNPQLVILPREWTRHRPSSPWYKKQDVPRGDYHPCPAELFPSFVTQRDKPKPSNPLEYREELVPKPTSRSRLRTRVEQAELHNTHACQPARAPRDPHE